MTRKSRRANADAEAGLLSSATSDAMACDQSTVGDGRLCSARSTSIGAYTPSSFDAVSSDCSRTQLLGSQRYAFTHSAGSSCLQLPLDSVTQVGQSQAASWCFEMCHQNESSFAEPALQTLLTRFVLLFFQFTVSLFSHCYRFPLFDFPFV